jgi:hypothetical protein
MIESARHLLGVGLPIHMANTAVSLASDEVEITTSQILGIDSGATFLVSHLSAL